MAAAFGICAQQFSDGDPAEALRLQRMQLIDQPTDQCYTKCIWEQSGQYDAVNNVIDVSGTIADLSAAGIDVPEHLVALGEPTDGSCEQIFARTRAFVQAQQNRS